MTSSWTFIPPLDPVLPVKIPEVCEVLAEPPPPAACMEVAELPPFPPLPKVVWSFEALHAQPPASSERPATASRIEPKRRFMRFSTGEAARSRADPHCTPCARKNRAPSYYARAPSADAR